MRASAEMLAAGLLPTVHSFNIDKINMICAKTRSPRNLLKLNNEHHRRDPVDPGDSRHDIADGQPRRDNRDQIPSFNKGAALCAILFLLTDQTRHLLETGMVTHFDANNSLTLEVLNGFAAGDFWFARGFASGEV